MRTKYGTSTAVIVVAVTLFGMLLRSSHGQDAPTSAPAAMSESATRGKAVFQEKCAICHNAESEEKKIGPGLKGFTKRGTFSSDGSKVTDETLQKFIQAGKGMMPAFSDTTLPPAKRDDVIAYVKSL